MSGSFSSFGDYYQCLDSESAAKDDSDAKFSGQYCLAKPVLAVARHINNKNYLTSANFTNERLIDYFKSADYNKMKKFTNSMFSYLNFTHGILFRFGICIPSTCLPQEVEHELNKCELFK